MSVFQSAELLIPREELLEDWAVIACDQFTSQPEYWHSVRARVGEKPSAYHLVFPEAELGGDEQGRIASIQANMEDCLSGDIFRRFPASFVYVERTLRDGGIRRGIVGVIDLERYDYRRDADSAVRATEQTVVERIPPRVNIRRGANMELSHVMLLMDDASGRVLDSLEEKKEKLRTLYRFPLMQGGGTIVGRLVEGEDAAALELVLAEYETEAAERLAVSGRAPLLYAVGDGNHSLAAAKACWEERKAADPSLKGSVHPARYAMVELQNIRDASQKFEPIHRLLTDVSVEKLMRELPGICAPGGCPVEWRTGESSGTVLLDCASGALPVAVLQAFLDRFLREYGGKIDYIHGAETAVSLAGEKGGLAFLMPEISKEDFFRGIAAGGVLPRKTFSMGHAEEKRYYLEAREIR